jgi:hypothetical protein
MLLLLTLLASIGPAQAFGSLDLLPRSSDSCPTSYASCSNTKLPDDFCCPSDSTCISLDNASSAICCPALEDCDYISPIVCDIQQQNTTLHPESVIKTTRLSESLAKCGDACCPFGYTCQENSTCALDKAAATTAIASVSSSSTTASSSAGTTTTPTTPQATITPVPSPLSENSANSTATDLPTSCPAFPGRAIAVGFFPGAIFGAAAALLVSLCARRRTHKNETQIQESKPKTDWTQRSSTGALLSISHPIPQDDTSYRTEFLRSPPRAKRSSTGGRSTRSMIHRTGSRVRSLFSGYPRADPRTDKDVPPVPMPAPFTPPRQRQQSTESIKIYSPPGVFPQSSGFLGPEPYPSAIARPDTTFTDLMHVGHSQEEGPSYPTQVGSKQNPFRDPGH